MAAAVASDLVVVAPVVLRDKKLRRNWRRNAGMYVVWIVEVTYSVSCIRIMGPPNPPPKKASFDQTPLDLHLYSHRTMHPRLPSSHHTRSSQNLEAERDRQRGRVHIQSV